MNIRDSKRSGANIEDDDKRATEDKTGRRRFVKAGLAAAPFLVTLAARPARAQETATGSMGNYTAYNNEDVVPIGPTMPDDDRNRLRRG